MPFQQKNLVRTHPEFSHVRSAFETSMLLKNWQLPSIDHPSKTLRNRACPNIRQPSFNQSYDTHNTAIYTQRYKSGSLIYQNHLPSLQKQKFTRLTIKSRRIQYCQFGFEFRSLIAFYLSFIFFNPRKGYFIYLTIAYTLITVALPIFSHRQPQMQLDPQ